MTTPDNRWGPDDEAGALNLVTEDVTRRALALVRTGRALSLAQEFGPATPMPPHRRPPARFMNRDAGDYALGARTPGGFKFAEDTVQFATHSGTHVDALAHVWTGDTLYNGHAEAATRTTRGAQRCGADKLIPVVTRGVLIDLVAARGEPLPARTPVTVSDVEQALSRSSVALATGDVVLLRTGWMESCGDRPEYFDDEPGITEHTARWLADQDVCLVGADNYAVEQQGPGIDFPAHLALLHEAGVPLLENAVLEPLARALEGRAEFVFILAPLPLQGSTASPVAPVVVL